MRGVNGNGSGIGEVLADDDFVAGFHVSELGHGDVVVGRVGPENIPTDPVDGQTLRWLN